MSLETEREDFLDQTRKRLKIMGADVPCDKFVFVIGHFYKHATGQMIHALTTATTTTWGETIIAETSDNKLMPVGNDDGAHVNWEESTEEEWMKNFS